MRFIKMHGIGNDFVVLDQKDVPEALTTAQIVHICDRHRGVGCDQLILLEPTENADVFARFYNSDGSESGACGNGTRCVAYLVMKEIDQPVCTIETAAGVLPCCQVDKDLIEVDMGVPVNIEDLDIGEGNLVNPVSVDIGNPHCVFFVDNLEDIHVEDEGKTYEHHTNFPDKTNVEFVEIKNETSLRLRTWERGAGLTLACGSGACAAGVAAVHRGHTGRIIEVELDGGNLTVEYREDNGHVLMTGPYSYVFDGTLKSL